MTFRNPPENYFFMKWNWPLIRKVSVWLFLSGLVAMVAIVVAMIWTLPKTCNPPTEWYQGKLMYEIFPASYSDSNEDGIGDLKGIASRVEYLDSLGVKMVRLNSIFPARDYPENYQNITSLIEIAAQLGNLTDFNILVNALHAENIYLILDLPVSPFIKSLASEIVEVVESNSTNGESSYKFLKSKTNQKTDKIAEILTHWTKLGVDGFYLKGLEFLIDDDNFVLSLRRWKTILGPDKIIIVSYNVVEATPQEIINIVLNNVNLIDIQLEMEGGIDKLSNQIESVFNGTLFKKAANPWVQWSLSNENSIRLANKLPFSNATLGATLLQLMLPGTPCIFYGDEIGLQQVFDPHEDRKTLQHMHQLAAMIWDYPNKPFTHKGILPWMHSQPTPTNFAQFEIVSKMTSLRLTSPSIYINSLNKDGINKANAEVKYKENDLLVIQRWYPRRKSYVVVSNLGCVHIAADLSTLLYAGQVVVGPTTNSKPESISFKYISLWPGESVIILLD